MNKSIHFILSSFDYIGKMIKSIKKKMMKIYFLVNVSPSFSKKSIIVVRPNAAPGVNTPPLQKENNQRLRI